MRFRALDADAPTSGAHQWVAQVRAFQGARASRLRVLERWSNPAWRFDDAGLPGPATGGAA